MDNLCEKGHRQMEAMELFGQLVGEWRGNGVAAFPTIAIFEYREELEFAADDTHPVLRYEQRTWKKLDTGEFAPSHWEVGFWRVLSESELEIACAQVGGRVEVLRGNIEPTPDGFLFKPRGVLVANDSRIDTTAREFVLQGDTLRYAMAMSTTAVSALTPHVHAELRRG